MSEWPEDWFRAGSGTGAASAGPGGAARAVGPSITPAADEDGNTAGPDTGPAVDEDGKASAGTTTA